MPRLHPPKPPLAFRIGIVGHRPNRLVGADLDAIRAALRQVLEAVWEELSAVEREHPELHVHDSDNPTVLWAMSPLAEGSDRLFAEEAIALRCRLGCVLPFPKDEYRQDFLPPKSDDPASCAEFEHLLGKADRVFQLDGSRAKADSAYQTAGRVVLQQSDLLIAVWDGEREGRVGGTEDLLDEAVRRDVPVVWIHARPPHGWQLLSSKSALGASEHVSPSSPLDGLRQRLHTALLLPRPLAQAPGSAHDSEHGAEEHEDPAKGLERFYGERRPRFSVALVWKIVRDLCGRLRPPHLGLRVTDFEQSVAHEWPDDGGSPIGQVVQRLRPFYAWTDGPAILYANRYRSAFLTAFLLAAGSVAMALVSVMSADPHAHEALPTALELGAIATIVLVVQLGRTGQWHERWIEYRLTAELIRHLRLLAPLGSAHLPLRVPAHWTSYGEPGASWMAWYARAAERALGLPDAVVDRTHLLACVAQIREIAQGQLDYHSENAPTYKALEHRAHRLGMILLAFTAGACAVHLGLSFVDHTKLPHWLTPGHLTFLGGFLPALGASLSGISNQGEFRRVARRSAAMMHQLEQLILTCKAVTERLEKGVPLDPDDPQDSVSVQKLASRLSAQLLSEVLDWRVVLLDRPLEAG